jgi:serine/threonine-protein kinase
MAPLIREPWAPGAAVGKYALLAKIASGGMAEIWLARQAGPKGFEKVVVVKKIADNLAEDPDFVEMFLDEARIAAQLNHPNIVQIYDLGESGGSFYIAMEYIPGENLATVVRAGNKAGQPIPIPYAVRLIANAAEGLAYAHSKAGLDGKHLQIVHRDISPHNLIVTYDGVLKIVDFGIARAAGRVANTNGGQLKGKTGYMSPEQARGERYDARSDIFSLGVVLFEMVTRTRLFAFDDSFQALAALTSKDPLPRPRDRNPEIPESLEPIVMRALERKPQARYQTARNLQAALEDWLRKYEDAPGTVEVGAYMLGLFRERIEERVQLVESARAGDVTPAKLGQGLQVSGKEAMPGATQAIGAPKRRSKWRSALLAVLILGGLGAGVYTQLERLVPLVTGRVLGSSAASTPAPVPPAAVTPNMLVVKTRPEKLDVPIEIFVDHKLRGPPPLELKDLSAGPHKIEARAKGYVAAEDLANFKEGDGQLLTVVLPLVAEPKPEAPADTAPSAEPAKGTGNPDPKTDPKGEVASVSPPPEKPKPPRDSPRRKTGTLTLNTLPVWTEVYLGNKSLGQTPIFDQELPVGRHTLRLVNEEKGISKTVEVEIKAGRLEKLVLRL